MIDFGEMCMSGVTGVEFVIIPNTERDSLERRHVTTDTTTETSHVESTHFLELRITTVCKANVTGAELAQQQYKSNIYITSGMSQSHSHTPHQLRWQQGGFLMVLTEK